MEQHEITELREIKTTVNKILLHLSGDKSLDQDDDGMIGDVKRLKVRVAKLERFKDRVIYVMIGAGFAGGYTISSLLTKFFSH